MIMEKIIVAHPNKQHSMQLAVALQDIGMLKAYITRLYTSWEHQPFSWLNWLPINSRDWIESTIFSRTRHSHPELELTNVYLIDTGLYLSIITLRRLGLLPVRQWRRVIQSTSISFQKAVAEIALDEADTLVCYDRFAYHSFSTIRDHNPDMKMVLDLSVAHPATAKQILIEEREFSPDYIESLDLAGVTSEDAQRTEQETVLADYILAGSNFVRESCIQAGIAAEKIFVLHYGTDMLRLEPAYKHKHSDNLILFFAGQVGQRKGIRYLFKALEKLALPDIELWICGQMNVSKKVLQKYSHLYKYFGQVPYSQMPEFYAKSDVFVLPTLLEGLSQVCLEAMARGKPVITTPNSGMEGILRDGKDGFIVPIRDVNKLAEKINYFYEHRDSCEHMGMNARHTIEQYTWKNYRVKVAQIFEHSI